MAVDSSNTPVVLCFSGADPTGGAGVQADIEAIASHGGHAAPVITAITIQDTRNVSDFVPVDADLIVQQARAVLEDLPVVGIKIGMVGSVENVEAIHSILTDYPKLPVTYDPVIHAGGGGSLSSSNMVEAINNLLLPLTYVLTPNISEVHALAQGADTHATAAMSLLDTDCDYILLTGTHANTEEVEHKLYGNHRELNTYRYERLPGSYHGSGCTLSASIAALIAIGQEPVNAIHHALDYTHKTLRHSLRLGMNQRHPNRFFWLMNHDDEDKTS